jgi:hypothetical protein
VHVQVPSVIQNPQGPRIHCSCTLRTSNRLLTLGRSPWFFFEVSGGLHSVGVSGEYIHILVFVGISAARTLNRQSSDFREPFPKLERASSKERTCTSRLTPCVFAIEKLKGRERDWESIGRIESASCLHDPCFVGFTAASSHSFLPVCKYPLTASAAGAWFRYTALGVLEHATYSVDLPSCVAC